MILIDIVDGAQGIEVLYDDIGNNFIQAKIKEKIYKRVGAEFGNKASNIALITRALYRFTIINKRCKALLADLLHSFSVIYPSMTVLY